MENHFSLLGGCSAVVRAATVSAALIWAYNSVSKRSPAGPQIECYGFLWTCQAKCKANAKDFQENTTQNAKEMLRGLQLNTKQKAKEMLRDFEDNPKQNTKMDMVSE